MKKIFLLIVIILTCSCFDLNKAPNIENRNIVRSIALANKTENTVSWNDAKTNNINLGGYIIAFNVSYLSHVTINSAYCSIYFNTTTGNNIVIDIQAANYPTYTFTNRYDEDTFSSIAGYNGGTVKYELPEYTTNIYLASFQKTQMADKSATNDDILNNLIYFIKPIEYQTITISYKVLPEESNNKNVDISLSWVDQNIDENINEYLSYIHDSNLSSIHITCLKKANYQAKLLIESQDNPSISNYLLIDFEEEFLGWELQVLELNKTLTLESKERITSIDDIKKEINNQSKGFLGTIPINNKEITNLKMSLSYVSVYLSNNMTNSFISSNETIKKVYQEARENIYSIDFVNYISNNYIVNLTNAQKKKIRDDSEIKFTSSYSVSFDYYGETHYFVIRLNDTILTQAFEDTTYVNVNSINSESHILFK